MPPAGSNPRRPAAQRPAPETGRPAPARAALESRRFGMPPAASNARRHAPQRQSIESGPLHAGHASSARIASIGSEDRVDERRERFDGGREHEDEAEHAE